MVEYDSHGLSNICLLPEIGGVGGPASFQLKFKDALAERGVHAHHDPQDPQAQALLVIAGTRRLGHLWRVKRRGIRVVQRLDGMNWIHRRRRTGMRHFIRSEYGNLLLAYIRRFVAEHIVYQSEFTRGWWQRIYGGTPGTDEVILNGVDLQAYSPEGAHQRPQDHIRVQVVEGHLKDGNDLALEFAALFAGALQNEIKQRVELCIAGEVPVSVQAQASRAHPELWLTFQGVVSRDHIPELDRSAHLLYSAEINAPCPNAVIEALACGLPVAAFETGSLPELVQGNAGKLVPYGGNPWKLDRPDIRSLAAATGEIVRQQEQHRRAAREWAEQAFDLRVMADRYLRALAG